MSTTLTIDDAMTKLRESVEGFNASKPEQIGSPSTGDVVRQGDLYLICVDALPEAPISKNRQLVPGTTQGSRHTIEGDCKVTEPVKYKDRPIELSGPAFECVSECTIAHPEHGHKILPAGTVWHSVYQRAFAEVIRRAKD